MLEAQSRTWWTIELTKLQFLQWQIPVQVKANSARFAIKNRFIKHEVVRTLQFAYSLDDNIELSGCTQVESFHIFCEMHWRHSGCISRKGWQHFSQKKLIKVRLMKHVFDKTMFSMTSKSIQSMKKVHFQLLRGCFNGVTLHFTL